MSTHNICFNGELMTVSLELPLNTLLICSIVKASSRDCEDHVKIAQVRVAG